MRACTESNSALFSYFFIMDVNKEKIRENEGLLTLVILCLRLCILKKRDPGKMSNICNFSALNMLKN